MLVSRNPGQNRAQENLRDRGKIKITELKIWFGKNEKTESKVDWNCDYEINKNNKES